MSAPRRHLNHHATAKALKFTKFGRSLQDFSELKAIIPARFGLAKTTNIAANLGNPTIGATPVSDRKPTRNKHFTKLARPLLIDLHNRDGRQRDLKIMTEQTTNLVLRNDTILGVCEAIGQDFGFNPNWLRLAFCAPIYWNPGLVLAAYLGLGVLVAATRYAFPDRTIAVASAAPVVEATPTVVEERERELIAA